MYIRRKTRGNNVPSRVAHVDADPERLVVSAIADSNRVPNFLQEFMELRRESATAPAKTAGLRSVELVNLFLWGE